MSESADPVEPKEIEFTRSADAEAAGDGSQVYHESGIADLDSQHDGRTRRVLINDRLVPTPVGLLVDTVTYGGDVASPERYHQGTDHFFYILEGEGVIEIEGEEFPLTAAVTVAWVGEDDRHRLYCHPDQEMGVLEYFSNVDYETVYTDGPACT